MSIMRNPLTGVITLAAAICMIASTMAWAQGQGGGGRPATEDTSAATECATGEFLGGDDDGCVANEEIGTSTATVCGLGEVLVSALDGSDVCISVISHCPCGSAMAMALSMHWQDLQPVQCNVWQTDTGDGICNGEDGDSCRVEVGRPLPERSGLLLEDQYIPIRRFTSCALIDYDAGEVVAAVGDLTQAEWDACVIDGLALAAVLGATCPSPPIVEGLP